MEALALKVELTVSKMKSEGKEEASREDAEVTILADLQSKQDQEAEHMMKDLAEKVRILLLTEAFLKYTTNIHLTMWFQIEAAVTLSTLLVLKVLSV